jgi:endonuclease/exonuclease/phosphatase (EEP) superfamily protein YafD
VQIERGAAANIVAMANTAAAAVQRATQTAAMAARSVSNTITNTRTNNMKVTQNIRGRSDKGTAEEVTKQLKLIFAKGR